MLRRCILLVLVASACTRDNPAFGEGTDGGTAEGSGSATTRPTSGPTDPSDPSLTGSVDSGETSATSPSTDASDDAQDPTTTTDPTIASDTTDPQTTGSAMCEVPKPPVFDIYIFDANSNPIDQQCGGITQITGPVEPGEAPNEMVLTVCQDDTCACAEGTEYTLVFDALSPSPALAIDNGANACMGLVWSRAGEDGGCGVSWLAMETRVSPAQHPRFMAANVAMPDWGHIVPPATLGPSIEHCQEDACVGEQPGFYTLMLGNIGPIVPGGEPVAAQLDPFTNGFANYDVYAQFAQVQDDCFDAVGWAAIEVE